LRAWGSRKIQTKKQWNCTWAVMITTIVVPLPRLSSLIPGSVNRLIT
jgi:hypothetical protein